MTQPSAHFLRRRQLLAAGAAALCSTPAAAISQPAWPIPGQPIRIIATQDPGPGSDVSARLIAHEMEGALNHPVIVENRPGAAGSLGHQSVATAAPDGHPLVLSSTGLPLVTPETTSDVKVRYTEFAPVAGILTKADMLVPKNTRPDVVRRLADSVQASLRSRDFLVKPALQESRPRFLSPEEGLRQGARGRRAPLARPRVADEHQGGVGR